MKVRIASLILAIGLVFSMVTSAFAAEDVAVTPVAQEAVAESTAVFYLDGQPLEGVTAQSVKGNYYVALRSILSLLDDTAVVEESGGKLTATAKAVQVNESADGKAEVQVLDTLTVIVRENQQYVVANGRYLYLPDGPKTVDGMLAIPVRMLAQIMNMSIRYDTESGRVHLARADKPGYLKDGDDYYDSDSVYWLSRIIYAESGNQSLAGRIAVGNVVMNRVNNRKFPDTIYNVIFQKNQFSPASSGSIHRTPNEGSVVAAKLVLDGAVVLDNALFFNTAGLVCYASKNRPYIATIGDHSFYA